MKCELVQRNMGALVDGELDPATQIEFERHVDVCADCQELLELDRLIRHELRTRAQATVTPTSLEAVSYTHLDVYKRQGRVSVARPRTCSTSIKRRTPRRRAR